MTNELIQQQINDVKTQLNDYDNAPVICELNNYRWHLGPAAEQAMDWEGAKSWCKSVGGELPPRDILLLCYLNKDTADRFGKQTYWSSTEVGGTAAWEQFFGNGTQGYYDKTFVFYVRAVCAIKLGE
jgi:hypothetical protein